MQFSKVQVLMIKNTRFSKIFTSALLTHNYELNISVSKHRKFELNSEVVYQNNGTTTKKFNPSVFPPKLEWHTRNEQNMEGEGEKALSCY